jgi:DNA modification methylase
VWEFPKPKKSEEHPTMKPVALLAVPIINSTAPGDLVIDFFGGSGSTLIACDRADRVCYTMEYDPKYASVIVARYKKERPEETIRVFRDGEWEVWEG